MRYIIESMKTRIQGEDGWMATCTDGLTLGRGEGQSEASAIRKSINNCIHVRGKQEKKGQKTATQKT